MVDQQQLLVQEFRRTVNDFIRSRRKLVDFLLQAATKLDEIQENIKALQNDAGNIRTLNNLFMYKIENSHWILNVFNCTLNKFYTDKFDRLSIVDDKNYKILNHQFQRYIPAWCDNDLNNRISVDQILIQGDINCLRSSVCLNQKQYITEGCGIALLASISAILLVHGEDNNLRTIREQKTIQLCEQRAAEFRQLAQDLTSHVNSLTQRIREFLNQRDLQLQQQQPPIDQNIRRNVPFNSVTIILLSFFLLILLLIIRMMFQIGLIIF